MLEIIKKVLCTAYTIGGFAGVIVTATIILIGIMLFIGGRESQSTDNF